MGAEHSILSHHGLTTTQIQIDFPQSRLKNKVINEKRLCGKPVTNASSSSLMQLILTQEWQRALIRIMTNPREASAVKRCRVAGVYRRVLPLHLVCAMNPPVEVVNGIIIAADGPSAAGTPMQTVPAKNGVPSSITTSSTNRKSDVPPATGQDCKKSRAKSRDKIINSITSLISRKRKSNTPSIMDSIIVPDKEPNFIEPAITTFVSYDEGQVDQVALQLTPTGDVSEMDMSVRTIDTSSFSFEEVGNELSPAKSVTGNRRLKLSSEFADGLLPLHIACLFRASPEVIESLVQAYPEGVQHKNKWGMLPLHIACSGIVAFPSTKSPVSRSNLNLDFLKSLMKVRTDATSMAAKDWKLDVVVSLLVSSFPQSVSVKSSNIHGATPIEYARNNLPEGPTKDKVMQALCGQNACEQQVAPSGMYLETWNMLWGESNASCSMVSTRTKLSSFISNKDWTAVRRQLSRSPVEASVWAVEESIDPIVRHLPIHVACTTKAPEGVITDLIDAYPEGLEEMGKNEALPLHFACQYQASLESIQVLLRSYPDAASIRDATGMLPIHAACMNDASPDVIEELLYVYPQGRDVKDYNGHTALAYTESFIASPNRTASEKALNSPP